MDVHLPDRLATRLADPGLSRAARRRFSPELGYGRQSGPPPSTARSAAVIVLFYPHQNEWHLPLTLRSEQMQQHAGQISFPGGLTERGESSREGVLRELEEELGVRPNVRLLGSLPEFYVAVSDFRVTPWIAVTDSQPAWRPDPAEVGQLLEIPIADLLAPESRKSRLVRRGRLTYAAPCFVWEDHKIWGVTGMILCELLTLVDALGE